MKSKVKDKYPYDYICHKCAKRLGLTWPEGHCATSHVNVCDCCHIPRALTALSDWLKPGEKTLKVWD